MRTLPITPGDRLGKCNEQCGDGKKDKKDKKNKSRMANTTIPELISDGELELTLYPNPSTKDFHLTIESNDSKSADILVYDLTGRVIEKIAGQPIGSELTVGSSLMPGVYVIEVRHGNLSKKIRVTKR